MNKDEIIQQLVNALTHSRKYVDRATKESYRADEVYAELSKALELAELNGFIDTNPEKEEPMNRW